MKAIRRVIILSIVSMLAVVSFPGGTIYGQEPARLKSRIAFVSNSLPTAQGAGKRVFVVNPDGTGIQRLSIDARCNSSCGNDKLPVWSPDGQYVAFLADLPKESGSALNVVKSDGSEERTLAHNVYPFVPVAWAPDGKSILFISVPTIEPDHKAKLYEVALDNTAPHVLLAVPDANVEKAVWSLDGRHLLVRLSNDAGASLQIRDATGALVTPLAEGRATAAWSPDGQSLALDLDDSLYLAGADGSEPQRLVDLPTQSAVVDWSPDGQWVLLTAAGTGQANDDLYLVNVGQKVVKRLTTQPANYAHPGWAPDSVSVIFEANLAAVSLTQIFILDIADGQIHPLIEQSAYYPSWFCAN